jgi:hypothetical protein
VPGSAVIRIDPGLNLGGLNDWRRIAFWRDANTEDRGCPASLSPEFNFKATDSIANAVFTRAFP